MFHVIADVLDPAGVAEARASFAEVEFVDGRATAGWHAKLVKKNEQASAKDATAKALRQTLTAKIIGNSVFGNIVLPKALSPLLLSRYEPGMEYGSHVDDAVMQGMRADVSFTLFLSDPETYAGGALVMETSAGEEEVKLPAGSLVAYPATTLHRVQPVTSGMRLAAVGWARSFVREAAKRELLFDLNNARQSLFARDGKTPEFDLLSKTSANLLRMWAED